MALLDGIENHMAAQLEGLLLHHNGLNGLGPAVRQDLLAELIVSVHPIVLGDGIPLYPRGQLTDRRDR